MDYAKKPLGADRDIEMGVKFQYIHDAGNFLGKFHTFLPISMRVNRIILLSRLSNPNPQSLSPNPLFLWLIRLGSDIIKHITFAGGVTCIGNSTLNLLLGGPKTGAGGGHHVFLDHQTAEVVRPETQG
jgi:hypothetical protein